MSEDDNNNKPEDNNSSERPSFSEFAQAAHVAADVDSDDEGTGEIVETNTSTGPMPKVC